MTNDNTANQNKSSPTTRVAVTESEEYKALFSQKQILQERIAELEEILKKDMQTNPAIGFQKAGDLIINPALSPITFPANMLSKFFLACRNVKQTVTLKLDNNGVVKEWVVE